MDTFAGYEVLSDLPADGGTEVYRARKGDGPDFHLKVFRRKGKTGEEILRIKRDLESLGKLDHPGLLCVLDAGTEGEDLWYAVEAFDGRTLEEEYRTRFEGEGALSMAEVMQLARGLAESLAYLHARSLVYGHLDPGNILLEPGGLSPRLRESFPGKNTGKAAAGDDEELRYASPEQIQLEEVDSRSDVYQFGLVLYHGLTGRLPLEDENPFQTVLRRMQDAMPPPSRAREEISGELDRIVLRCLKSDPGERYINVGVLQEELVRLDPATGSLPPGEALAGPGEAIEPDLFAGLIVPGKGGQVQPPSAMAAVVPGLVAGVLLLLGLVLLFR